MADEKDTTKDDTKAVERHEHTWMGYVVGDGNAAVHETRCTTCNKVKKD